MLTINVGGRGVCFQKFDMLSRDMLVITKNFSWHCQCRVLTCRKQDKRKQFGMWSEDIT